MIELRPMDYVRGALFNALHSGLTLDDVCRMSANADSPEAFDRAVNILASVTPNHATKPSRARKTGIVGYLQFLWQLARNGFMGELHSYNPDRHNAGHSMVKESIGTTAGRFTARITIPAILALAIYHAWVM